jgi:hypothetical protein
VEAAAADYDAFVAKWPDDKRVPGIPVRRRADVQEAGLHEQAIERASAADRRSGRGACAVRRTEIIESLQKLGRDSDARMARSDADAWASTQPRSAQLEGLLGGLRLMDVNDAYAALVAETLPSELGGPGDADRLLSRRMADKLGKAVALESAVAHTVEAGDVASAERRGRSSVRDSRTSVTRSATPRSRPI